SEADLRHGILACSQHDLRLLDPPAGMVAVRRNAEGLLERPTEIVSAQASGPRQRRERDLFGQVLLDIAGYDPLLPTGEPAPHRRLGARNPSIQANQFMHQNEAKS